MKKLKFRLCLIGVFLFCYYIINAQNKDYGTDSTNNGFNLTKYYDHPCRVLNFFKFKKFTLEKPSKLLKFCKNKEEVLLTVRDDVNDSAIVCFNLDTIVNSFLSYEPSSGLNRKNRLIKIDNNQKGVNNYITIFLVKKSVFLRFNLDIKYDSIMVYFDERYKTWTIHYDFKKKKDRGYS
jgi:hypothetical protein